MSGVKIRVRADAAQAQREMGKLERSIVGLDKKATAVSKTFRNLAIGITAAFTGGALTKGITRNADAMTNLGNRVKLVTKDLNKTNATMNELFKIAERSRGSIEGAAETFNRFGLALKDADKPVAELLKVTEAVQKAATISGAGAQSANAAIIQLGQGLASGQLRGQELNSVLEQMPRLAQAIADGMGIPFGKLREEAMKGKITAEAVYKAILDGAAEIDSEFNTLDATVSGLATVFGNEWTRAIANLDKAVGTSRGISDGIRLATNAVRSFGTNIIGFSVILSGEMLLAKIRIKRLATDIGGFIKGIFTGDVKGTDVADRIVKGYETAKTKLSGLGAIAIEFTVEKIDLLKGMLPSMDTAKSSISAFTTFISDLFKDLWKAVVGDSYWTGIFDPAHMEPGQSLAIGSSIRKFLDNPLAELRAWKTDLLQLFSDLNFEIYDKWLSTVTSIQEVGFKKTLESELKAVKFNTDGIIQFFDDMSFEVYDTWQQLVNDVNAVGLVPTFKIRGEKLWVDSLRSMGTAYDTFNETLTTAKGADELVLPTASEVAVTFDTNLAKMRTSYTETKDLLQTSLQFNAFTGLSEAFERDIKPEFDKINAFLRSSAEATAATFSLILGVALNKKLRGFVFKYGIKGGILTAIGLLGHDEEFRKSVRNIAEGFGEILAKAFSEDGDFVGKILTGLLNVASDISAGFIKGFFPEGFEDEMSAEIAQKLGTAITLAAGALIISSKARAALLLVGKKLFGSLIGGFKARSDKEIQAATNKSIGKSKVGLASRKLGSRIQNGLRTGFGMALGPRLQTKISASLNGIKTGGGTKIGNSVNKLGDKIGTAMSGKVGTALKTLGGNATGGALAGLSTKFTVDALVDDEALGGFGEIVDGAVAGGALAARLTEGFSPIIQIGATFVGVVVGGLLDLWNNPELLAKVKKFAKDFGKKVLDTFLNLPTIVGTAMIEGFITAYIWLEDKLMNLGQKFVDKFIKGDGQGSTDKNSQLRLFPGETPKDRAIRIANLEATKELTKALLAQDINVNQAKPGVQGFSVGGAVNGPGTGTSDDIPAMLSNGEFVMKQSAVQKFGPAFMAAINNGKMPQFRAGGGGVGDLTDLFGTGTALVGGTGHYLEDKTLSEALGGMTGTDVSAVNAQVNNYVPAMNGVMNTKINTPRAIDAVEGITGANIVTNPNGIVDYMATSAVLNAGNKTLEKQGLEPMVSSLLKHLGLALPALPNSPAEILGFASDSLSLANGLANIYGDRAIAKWKPKLRAADDFYMGQLDEDGQRNILGEAFFRGGLPQFPKGALLGGAAGVISAIVGSGAKVVGGLGKTVMSLFGGDFKGAGKSALGTTGHLAKTLLGGGVIGAAVKGAIGSIIGGGLYAFDGTLDHLLGIDNTKLFQYGQAKDKKFNSDVPMFNTGGAVNGPGTGTSDDIPAMLSNGEFVMQQSAVQKFGSGFMNAINAGKKPVFRAGGGDIGRFTLGGQAQEIAIELRRDDLDLKERKALVAQLERITRLTEQQTADLLSGGGKGDAVLDNLKVTSESAQQYAENFNNQLATALSRALHGDDLGDIGDALLDTFTSTVIDAFSKSFADKFLESFSFDTLFDGIESLGSGLGGAAKGDFGGFGGTPTTKSGGTSGYGDSDAGGADIGETISGSLSSSFSGFFSSFDGILGGISGIFGGLTDSLGGLFSGLGSSLSGMLGGGSGGGGLGSLISVGMGFLGFSQGGIVPATATSQAGKDSVPAMLMPGEVVLSKNDVRNMDANNGSTTQQFSINVQGDVSRQTRKEIVKMMPQIAGGVNQQNKERGVR